MPALKLVSKKRERVAENPKEEKQKPPTVPERASWTAPVVRPKVQPSKAPRATLARSPELLDAYGSLALGPWPALPKPGWQKPASASSVPKQRFSDHRMLMNDVFREMAASRHDLRRAREELQRLFALGEDGEAMKSAMKNRLHHGNAFVDNEKTIDFFEGIEFSEEEQLMRELARTLKVPLSIMSELHSKFEKSSEVGGVTRSRWDALLEKVFARSVDARTAEVYWKYALGLASDSENSTTIPFADFARFVSKIDVDMTNP
jgi:hypothetical protein